MALYCLLIGAIFINLRILVSSQPIFGDTTHSPDKTSICSDESLTRGYKCEDYDVITEDGYILRLERFPEGRFNHRGRNKKPPVYLQHGLIADGMIWFTLSHGDQTLPLILVESGFDVWIGNVRGTRFSKKHVSENFTNSNEYWDFSFVELGKYDLQASIRFVYEQTGQKVHYAGHSLGTTMLAVAALEWNIEEMVKSATLLCPIIYLNHVTNFLASIGAHAHIAEISASFGMTYLDLKMPPLGAIEYALCNTPGVNCWTLLADTITGPNCCLNASAFNLFMENVPQPSSMKTFEHLSQSCRTGVFAKYDYGNPNTNLEHYGVPEAPVYDLQKIPKTFPILICSGGKDQLAAPADVRRVRSELKYHNIHNLYIDEYSHFDFINAMTAKDVLYPDVVTFMKRFN
ncbi:Lipase [Heracleum sosnowskyi]|uniref:Lipase n=1 Tax=Heracleum sosnowskyi TaxID=360622 RepID=A0AAD8HJ63_9APIA|nr:Lipase [Heracleum sosnowskyi]